MITLPRALALLGLLAALLVVLLWCAREAPLAPPEIDSEARGPSEVANAPLEGHEQLAQRAEVVAEAGKPARVQRTRPELLKGTVHGRDGALLAKAEVRLARTGWPGLIDTALTDEYGAFQLRYPSAGDYELVARVQGQGVSELSVLALPDDARALAPLEVLVAEPDFLAGVLEDSDGRPIGEVDLWAFPASYTAADSEWLFGWRNRPVARTLRGECSGFTSTNRSGQFRFDGLAPGRYFVVRETELDPPHGVRWSHATGESALRLVEDHCWLRLVCAEQGAARPFCAGVLASGPSDALLEPLKTEEQGAGLVYEVEPCRVYRCGFFDAARGLVEEEISIPNRPGTIEKRFALPGGAGAGTLDLEMPSLRPLAELSVRRVRLRSAASGVLLESWGQRETDARALPAGSYMLEVAEPPARGWDFLPRADPLGEALLARQKISIEAGGVTRFEVRD